MAHPRTEILSAVRSHLVPNVPSVSGRIVDPKEAARPVTRALPFLVVGAEEERRPDVARRDATTSLLTRPLVIGIQVVAESETQRDDVCSEVELTMGSVAFYSASMLMDGTSFGTRVGEGDRVHLVAMLRYVVQYRTTSRGEEP